MNMDFDTLKVVAAVVIFLVCYAFIITEKINRAVIAVLGALLMIILSIVDFKLAYTKHVHWEVIFLLLGMMVMVGVAKKTGIFEYLAVRTAKSANGDPIGIMVRLAILTALGSAFIDNVTTVLLVAPITIAIAKVLRLNPVPFLITQIIICNIGGAATLVGDPPNIMIGSAAGISFNAFLIHITPFIFFAVFVVVMIMKQIYKKKLHVNEIYVHALMEIDPASYITDWKMAKRAILAFAITFAGFVTHQIFHLQPAVIAMIGATLIMLLCMRREEDVVDVFSKLEWVTIFFFVGLFIMVGGLVDVGVITKLATIMIDLTGGNHDVASIALLWGAGVASAFIDNIPLVATMIPMVQDMIVQMGLNATETATLWWSLALGACLGGNGTIIASSANLVIASIAHREGYKISFIAYFKIGFTITIITLMLATAYVYVFFIRLGLSAI